MSVRDVQYKLDFVLLEEISLHHTTFFVVEIHLKKPLELNNCKLLNMYIHRTMWAEHISWCGTDSDHACFSFRALLEGLWSLVLALLLPSVYP